MDSDPLGPPQPSSRPPSLTEPDLVREEEDGLALAKNTMLVT